MQVCVCVCECAYVCVEYLVACFFARTPLSSLLRAFAAKSTAKATHNTRTGPPPPPTLPYPTLPLTSLSPLSLALVVCRKTSVEQDLCEYANTACAKNETRHTRSVRKREAKFASDASAVQST